MESFEDGTLLPRNSGSATSAYSLESYASSETPGADYTALNDKVYLAGMASLAEGIIDRLSIKHLVVMSSVPDAVVRQVWRMSRLECRVSSSSHFYEALPQIIGFVEMASYDMGDRVLILSKNGNRRGAAVGIAFCKCWRFGKKRLLS